MSNFLDAALTMRERCYILGCDTPEQLAYEDEMRNQEYWIEHQDAMEARGGPIIPQHWSADYDDIPF
jgi:hypothetical protein